MKFIFLNTIVLTIQAISLYIVNANLPAEEFHKLLVTNISSTLSILVALNVALWMKKPTYIHWKTKVNDRQWNLLVTLFINNMLMDDLNIRRISCKGYISVYQQIKAERLMMSSFCVELKPAARLGSESSKDILYTWRKRLRIKLSFTHADFRPRTKTLTARNPHWTKYAILLFFRSKLKEVFK